MSGAPQRQQLATEPEGPTSEAQWEDGSKRNVSGGEQPLLGGNII